ncbi:MAG: hypothetical protein AVDCRST_MAG71-1369 [uncultured Lysobacter sp.]|uniref:Uncharacterized protein n=1 Tax=uncultured Lysobacter sp. TaxID=271060 RepID=A0A6J4L9R6_9GAMM|nr:MAG: hypothetical protein AVDCRST_MAG71-1369 [uncultured Lysobacter sp.]
MNVLTSLFSTRLPRPQNRNDQFAMVARPAKRERDFGIGYGSSSGYATTARYAPASTAPRFRFA